MKTILYILTTLFTLTAALRGSIDNAPDLIEDEVPERALAQFTDCPYANKALVYFKISVQVIPGKDTCLPGEHEKFSFRINTALHDVGLADDDVKMVGRVCIKPGHSRLLQEFQRLLQSGFWTYNGGGGCAFCDNDNGDGRRILAIRGSGADIGYEADMTEFNGEIAPDLMKKLEDDLNGNVLKVIPCAGEGTKVKVTMEASDAKNLQDVLTCSPLDVPTIDEELGQEKNGKGTGMKV